MLRLAIQFGCTLTELSERMPAWELPVWAAYYSVDPWGSERQDIGAAVVSSTIASAVSAFGKSPRSFQPADFMPSFNSQESVQTPAMVQKRLELIHALAAARRKHGKSDNRPTVRDS